MLQIDETGMKELRIKSNGKTIWIEPNEVLNVLEWFKHNKPYEVKCILGEPTDKDIASAALYECLRPQIRRMAHHMEQKFALHDKERGNPFTPADMVWLQSRFQDEFTEFLVATGLFKPDYFIEKRNPLEVWKEAADVCNIMTMLAVNYERIWDEEHSKKKKKN